MTREARTELLKSGLSLGRILPYILSAHRSCRFCINCSFLSASTACVLSCFSRVQLFATPWTVAHQAPLSMGFSRQEYWSGLPFPFPGDLPDPGIEPTSLMSPALVGRFFTTSAPWEAHPLLSSISFLSLGGVSCGSEFPCGLEAESPHPEL